MKKLIVILCIGVLTLVGGVAPSSAADTRQFQESTQDKTTPEGMSPRLDVTSISFGLNVEDELEVFANLQETPTPADFASDAGAIILAIDTNLDGSADYSITNTGDWDPQYSSPRTLIAADGSSTADCEVWGWITEGAVGWNVPKSCLKGLGSTVGVKVVSIEGGDKIDTFPDGALWFKPKTGYMAAAVCGSSNSNKKLTYKDVTYICMKTSGKWGWKDYGPIAAKSAKYATEKAFYGCNIQGKLGVKLGDGGKSLTLETAKKYDFSIYVSDAQFACVKKYVAMPSWVTSMIGQTRSLDGMVKASWGKTLAFWNYSPDNGLNITFTVK